MNDDERRELGREVRRAVLGDEIADRAANVDDLTSGFRDAMTRFAWGEVWAREGLDRRTRSALTIGALVALSNEDELRLHLVGALRNGLSASELAEAMLHLAVYCGSPAANRGMLALRATLGAGEST
jgi:alkylhydroperoxidase/carboxymuconolactone decarboxylase family protein YurZ